MFRPVWWKVGGALNRAAINGDSSSCSSTSLAAKYFVFSYQNQNVAVISNSRVSSSFSTSTGNTVTSSYDSDSYLINSCGLSQNEAITASEKLNFKTKSNPVSVLTLLRTYGFTELHITKLISKFPSIISLNPDKILKPKFDFFISKGIYGLDLANFILKDPLIIKMSLNKGIIPSFDILKIIVQSDAAVIKMIKRNSWILSTKQVNRLMVNLELLRNQGVPETNFSNYLIHQPRAFLENANRFKEIVDKVKDMGFNRLETTFLRGIIGLASMSEANWKNKMDVYKRWGWSEDHIQTAFRKHPYCMTASERKIMAVMNFLVNDMGYESLSIAEYPLVINCSLKERIIPRCSVIRILVSRGLIKDKIRISTISTMVEESFLEKFVIKYEQEVPGLLKAFQGQLNYQQLLQN